MKTRSEPDRTDQDCAIDIAINTSGKLNGTTSEPQRPSAQALRR